MSFNHYAKIKRILDAQPAGWYIQKIDEPTSAKNFKGKTREYTHYYRIYDSAGRPIKYCKYQQLDRLANTLQIPHELLPMVE